MELSVKPILADLGLYVRYKEAMLGLVEREETRTPLVREFLRAFDLRLNDIKFTRETPSGNFLHFAKYYGSALFDVSFGLEEASSRIFKVESIQQALDLYSKLFQILDEIPISLLRISIGNHLSTEADLASFFESLNPNPPKGFKDLLSGGGVQYHLRIPNHNLVIYIIFANSVIYANALFLNIENHFSPYGQDFQNAFKIVMDYYDVILKELGIRVQTEE